MEGGPWLVAQFLTDGRLWRGAVWNASPDAVSELTVRVPDGMGRIRSAEHLDAHGVRTKAKVKDDRIAFPMPVHQWELVVLG